MEDNNSTTSSIKSCDYLSLLQAIDKLSNLVSDWNNPDRVLRKTWDISKIEAIFQELTVNIRLMCNQEESETGEENFTKNTMFSVTILNAVVRVSVMDGFSYIISREPFQSMFKELNTASDRFIGSLINETVSLPMLSNDIFNSMLMNLVKDDLIDTCFKRLLSNDTLPNEGKIPFSFAVESPLSAKQTRAIMMCTFFATLCRT